MSGSRKSSTTQSAGCPAQVGERRFAGLHELQIDVVVAEKLRHADLLGLVVLDDQQALAPRLGIGLDPSKRLPEAIGRGRLGQEREGATGQPVLAIFVEGDDLHRNMAGRGILLELAQHRPAEHVGQKNIERDGGRPVLVRELERFGATHRDDHLEPLVVGEIDQNARIVGIILDNQQRGVAGHDVGPVVGQLLGRALFIRGEQQRQ